MPFIGNTPQTQSFAPAIDYFSGNGVTVTFTLSRPVVSVAQLTVAVDNVIQNPSSAFTVSGNSITFTSAPLSGTNNIWVEYTSLITTYAAISQDPSVIGDITATGGFLAEGDFGNSYIDGTIVDYVTGNARITTGPIDDMTFYHGGTSGRSEMMRLSYAGNSYIVGNLGVGTTTSPSYALDVRSTAAPAVRLSRSGTAGQIASMVFEDGTATLGTGNTTRIASDSGAMSFSTGGTSGAITGGTERMRITSTGLVGIGETTPNNTLSIKAATATVRVQSSTGTNAAWQLFNNSAGSFYIGRDNSAGTDFGVAYGSYLYSEGAYPLVTWINGSERMRITSGGAVCVGTTSAVNNGTFNVSANNTIVALKITGSEGVMVDFRDNSNEQCGYIYSVASSNTTTYATSSDYRLKENIAPMTGALDKVAQLKPVTYTWKKSGTASQGFIAHELQTVVPECVVGEKDAVDEEGNPKYQGVDTSFLVATLTAAIQELKAEVDSLKAQLEAK